jgi:beta-glucosidase
MMTSRCSLAFTALCTLTLGACRGSDPPVTTAAIVAPPAPPVEWPRVTNPVPRDANIEARIAELLGQLTLEQKVAQMVQPDIRWVTPDDVRKYRIGSILNGGGGWPASKKHSTVADWVRLADRYYDASMDTSGGAPAIPIIWGVDAVHGHNNVIGATLFPHNIGLGAAHDPELIERIGEITAREVAVTGLDWVFAPTVAVVRDDRWGRTYEGYSEDPEIVRTYAARIVRGLQGVPGTPAFLDPTHVTATAKHFLGDGGTQHGIDHGDNCSTEQELLNLHAQGYIGALEGGVQTVMASYNSWQGVKMHGQRYLLTEVLKRRLGFDGLIVSDWDGIDEVQGCSKDRCAHAVNAGIDLFMVPSEWKGFIANTVAQVRAGDIPEGRINDAVTRILRVKLRAGLFEHGRPSSRPAANHRELLGAADHRAVAREAVRKSLVLLKNSKGVLPLHANANVLVAGDGADNIPKQTGGWSVTWQGTENSNADFPGSTSIFAGIRASVAAAGGTATLSVEGTFRSKPDVAIVVFGENPYAEWFGNIPVLDRAAKYRNGATPVPEASELGATCAPSSPQDAARSTGSAAAQNPAGSQTLGASSSVEAPAESHDLALLRSLKQQGIPVVAVFLTGRPLWITPELEASDAFVVAWLPGTEGGGVADVLFRKADDSVNYSFTGKLSYSWPRTPQDTTVNRGDASYSPLFPYGFGLTYEGSAAQSPTAMAAKR